jgi:aromatic ring-cleaving dioxygenase
MEKLYGYFSKTQQDNNKKMYIYRDTIGKYVTVTEVSSKDKYVGPHTDMIFMGEIIECMKTIEMS